MPLGFALGSSGAHTLFVGLGSHNEFPPVFIVVRAGEVVDRLASSLYLIASRVAHLTDNAAAQRFPRLLLLFAPSRSIS